MYCERRSFVFELFVCRSEQRRFVMRFATVLMLVVSMMATEAQACWFTGRIFRVRRAAAVCKAPSAVQKSAVQKSEPVKQEATQKTSEAAQKSAAVNEGGPLYQLCLKKARIQAARGGRCFHPGGGFGGARAEGVGSAGSASAALANCCFTGQRRLAASAVVRGANGRYYACKLFW